MTTRGIRILVFVCGLLQVLPFGWCCLLPRAEAKAETSVPVPHTPSCCHQPQPASESPTKLPLPVHECPCGDRQAFEPTVPEKAEVSASATSLPLTTVAPLLVAEAIVSPVCLSATSLVSLQVIHCVWRC